MLSASKTLIPPGGVRIEVKQLRALAPEQLARAEERLRNPPPGSKIEAAQKFGIDLALMIGQLRRSPEERAVTMQSVAEAAEQMRGAARRTRR
jgi:hypothetical protein